MYLINLKYWYFSENLFCALFQLINYFTIFNIVPAPPVPDCSCPAKESNGFCPVPDDCEQFIHCDDKGMPVVYNCSTGTIWNQKIETCVAGFKKYSCKYRNSIIPIRTDSYQNKTFHLHIYIYNVCNFGQSWNVLVSHNFDTYVCTS